MPQAKTSIPASRELKIIATAHAALEKLAEGGRLRAIHWLLHRLGVEVPLAPLPEDAPASGGKRGKAAKGSGGRAGTASDDSLAQLAGVARSYLQSKKPKTEVERAICLASVAHQKGRLASFKTRDITRLNAAAGGKPFANTAAVMTQGRARGFFQLRKGGTITLTTLGIRYAEALPNTGAARELVKATRGPGKKRGPKPGSKRGPGRPKGSRNARKGAR